MHCLNQNKIFTNRFQYAGTKFCSVCAKRFCVNLSAAHALDHLCQAIWEVSNWHFSQLVLWSAIIILELCKKILNIFIFMVKVVSCIYYFFSFFFLSFLFYFLSFPSCSSILCFTESLHSSADLYLRRCLYIPLPAMICVEATTRPMNDYLQKPKSWLLS